MRRHCDEFNCTLDVSVGRVWLVRFGALCATTVEGMMSGHRSQDSVSTHESALSKHMHTLEGVVKYKIDSHKNPRHRVRARSHRIQSSSQVDLKNITELG